MSLRGEMSRSDDALDAPEIGAWRSIWTFERDNETLVIYILQKCNSPKILQLTTEENITSKVTANKLQVQTNKYIRPKTDPISIGMCQCRDEPVPVSALEFSHAVKYRHECADVAV